MNKRCLEIYTNIQNLLRCYSARAAGNTYLMVNGIERTIPGNPRKISLLVRNTFEGEQILEQYNVPKENVRLVPYNNLDKLMGIRGAIAIDHSVIVKLLLDVLELIRYLMNKIDTLESKEEKFDD